ncbi:MAG: recombinase family protein [Clostridia bacterium]
MEEKQDNQVSLIYDPIPMQDTVRRACAYARVSTRSEAQAHSFMEQSEYWKNKLSNDPKFIYVGVYADNGISGKSRNNRQAFNEMVEYALAGNIDIIFTKSVMRFGRNLLDVLKVVRELKQSGVIVYFEEEDLYSDSPMADTLLSIRATVAEEELEDMSQNQKWAIRKRFKEGWALLNDRTFGYRLRHREDGSSYLVIDEEQARAIRRVFELYLQGYGVIGIAKKMTQDGYKTAQNAKAWSGSTVSVILKNEIYIGDILMQKTYMENYKQTLNRNDKAEAPKIYIENCHEPIITKEIFQTAQEIMERKRPAKLLGSYQKQYAFRGKIECGECKATFNHKMYQYKGKPLYGFWTCVTKNKKGVGVCDNHNIKEEVLQDIFLQAFNEFVKIKVKDDEVVGIEKQIAEYNESEKRIYGLMFNGYVDRLSYIAEHNELQQKIAKLEKELIKKSKYNIYKEYKRETANYDDKLVSMFLEKAIVQNWTVAFIFINGVTIVKKYTNGKSGNKIGWYDKDRGGCNDNK